MVLFVISYETYESRAGKNVKTKGTQHLLSRENPLPAICFPARTPFQHWLSRADIRYVDCGTRVTLTHPIIACQCVLSLGNMNSV